MLAIGFGAAGVKRQGVIFKPKTLCLSNGLLPALDFRVKKFLNPAAVHAHQMVMVLALVQLKHRFAGFKIASGQQTRLFKLHQDAVNRGQANVRAFVQQHPVNVFSRHVPERSALENLKNFQAWQGCLEAGVLEFFNVGHGDFQEWAGLAGIAMLSPLALGAEATMI